MGADSSGMSYGRKQTKFLFDKRDHELIRIVNNVQQVESSARFARSSISPIFIPMASRR